MPSPLTPHQVLDPSDPSSDAQLHTHTSKYPLEATPLLDTALTFGGKERSIPEPQKSFIPVGHICLGAVSLTSVNPSFLPPDFSETGWFWISNFYVSRALQGGGLGRAAMDTVENMAISEPLNARVLGLNAICAEDGEREEKYAALGLPIPPVS
jgi:GNAT superfamily N-acetyltransferase